MRSIHIAAEESRTGTLLMHGVIGGIVAGIAFALAEMIMNLALGQPFFGPLRMIGSMAIGREALNPAYPLMNAALVGMGIHVLLSALFGVIFILLTFMGGSHNPSGRLLVTLGAVYGMILWIVNFLIIAPNYFPQFLNVNQFWNGFVAHAVFFGMILGWYSAKEK